MLEDLENNDFKELRKKINVKNVATYHQTGKLFNSTELAELTLCYIERCFTTVCETKNFLELDFNLIENILGSSELRIDSELEVLNAADEWVQYNYKARNKLAKDLLLKVRLPLLPTHVINSLLTKNWSFTRIDDCVNILKEVSQKSFYQNKPNIFYSNRFCTQNMFDILVSGGRNRRRTERSRFQQVDGNNFDDVKSLASMTLGRQDHKLIYCRGDIYVVGGDNNHTEVVAVEKYSFTTNTWVDVANLPDDRRYFCPCVFMNNIFIIGGRIGNYDFLKSCLQFDTKVKKFKEVAAMNERRSSAACAVFEEKFVVSGGYRGFGNNLNTVEAYDHITNTWSYMPNMIERRHGHSSVVNKNKLFVIGSFRGNGRENCEVFDSTSRKFVYLKQKSNSVKFRLGSQVQTFCIGSKLITLGDNSSTAMFYDVEKEEWSEEQLGVTEDIAYFGCTTVPMM